MEVRLADCAGFCFGVKRAVDTVYEQIKTGKTIYTYGPIVHNEEVVRELEELGVKVLESKEEQGMKVTVSLPLRKPVKGKLYTPQPCAEEGFSLLLTLLSDSLPWQAFEE